MQETLRILAPAVPWEKEEEIVSKVTLDIIEGSFTAEQKAAIYSVVDQLADQVDCIDYIKVSNSDAYGKSNTLRFELVLKIPEVFEIHLDFVLSNDYYRAIRGPRSVPGHWVGHVIFGPSVSREKQSGSLLSPDHLESLLRDTIAGTIGESSKKLSNAWDQVANPNRTTA